MCYSIVKILKILSLCFVDEILRGTNTIERIASSCEVLKKIASENTLCFAATHDVELTYIIDISHFLRIYF